MMMSVWHGLSAPLSLSLLSLSLSLSSLSLSLSLVGLLYDLWRAWSGRGRSHDLLCTVWSMLPSVLCWRKGMVL